jgi:small subunit ribosomal protein S2
MFDISSLLKGSKIKQSNPKMWSDLFKNKSDIPKTDDITFDVIKTLKYLKLAGRIIEIKIKYGGQVLFVGTSNISSALIKKYADESNSFYVNSKWLGGMLTNWRTFQKRLQEFKYLEQIVFTKKFENLSKKDYSKQYKKYKKLESIYSGIKGMVRRPSIVIFASQSKHYLAIRECFKLGIPTICITNSNSDPSLIPYIIPTNDNSYKAINFILKYLSKKIYLNKRSI